MANFVDFLNDWPNKLLEFFPNGPQCRFFGLTSIGISFWGSDIDWQEYSANCFRVEFLACLELKYPGG